MREKDEYRLTIGILLLVILLLALIANGWRVDNIDKNKELERLKPYEKAWHDFNNTHIPESCLERLPEIEAIYKEGK